MAQTILKEFTYNGSKVVVEVARRDALGRTINTTYATIAALAEKLDASTFQTYINETAPAEYVAQDNFKTDWLDTNNVAYKSDIPDTSDFITVEVDNLANYYTKSQTYTKTEVDGIINTLKTGAMQVVEELPGTGQEGIIYLVGTGQPYDMYIWEGNAYIEIGTTEIDLSGYVPTSRQINGHALTANITITKSDVGLGSVVNTGDSATPASGGTTKFTTGGAYTMQTTLQGNIDKKQDKLTAGNGITISGATIASVITTSDVTIDLQ